MEVLLQNFFISAKILQQKELFLTSVFIDGRGFALTVFFYLIKKWRPFLLL